jgi:hypothetical protein
VVVLQLLTVFLSGCSAKHAHTLQLSPAEVPAAGLYMPDEIRRMMQDLGYQQVVDSDPVRTAERYQEYRTQYRLYDGSEFRVDVHMRMVGNDTCFYFYQVGREFPDEAGERRYQELRARLQFQFGAGNVSECRSWFRP